MTLALRYPISVGVVFSALLATSCLFAFGRPQFHPAIEIEKRQPDDGEPAAWVGRSDNRAHQGLSAKPLPR
jgi:hypothetical protein